MTDEVQINTNQEEAPKRKREITLPEILLLRGMQMDTKRKRKRVPSLPPLRTESENETTEPEEKCRWCKTFRRGGNVICSNCGKYFPENLRRE